MFEIVIASDDIHNKVYAEVYYQGKYVALLNQEKGQDNLEIEFPDCNLDKNLITRVIPLTDFVSLISRAKLKLTQE